MKYIKLIVCFLILSFVMFENTHAIQNKTFLVTGGCGFIGSHLVDKLVQEGHQVVIIDDLSYGKKEYCNKKAILVQGSICNKALLDKVFSGYQFAGCYHLAAVSSVLKSNEAWVETHQVNATGAINIFDVAAKNKTPVVYASSAAVYGDSKKLRDETDQVFPMSAYAVDKYSTELNARVAYRIHHNSSIGLRFFNVYGPRQDHSPYSGVIAIYSKFLLNNKRLRVDGDGKQVRDFIYVADIVNVLVLSMKQLVEKSFKGAEVINVSTGKGITLLDLIKALERAADRASTIYHSDARKGDIQYLVGNNSKLEKILAYKPKVSLDEGLKKTIDYYKP